MLRPHPLPIGSARAGSGAAGRRGAPCSNAARAPARVACRAGTPRAPASGPTPVSGRRPAFFPRSCSAASIARDAEEPFDLDLRATEAECARGSERGRPRSQNNDSGAFGLPVLKGEKRCAAPRLRDAAFLPPVRRLHRHGCHAPCPRGPCRGEADGRGFGIIGCPQPMPPARP